MKIRKKRMTVVILMAVFFALVFFSLLLKTPSVGFREIPSLESVVVCDREGRVLRHVPGENYQRHLWTPLSDLPPQLRNAFIAAEDKRFYQHYGFDPLAIGRAVFANLRACKTTSGASTIT